MMSMRWLMWRGRMAVKWYHGPEDVFDAGRMLHIQDPTGALLNLWQPYKSIGAGIVNTVGAMCWHELVH